MSDKGDSRDRVAEFIDGSVEAIASLREQVDALSALADVVVKALKAGNKVLTAGNGGSAADALHMAEELIGRFRGNRQALPAVALVADCTALTCIGNDFGFDHIFSRQVEGLGREGDVLVLFSTSGQARNLTLALEASKQRGMITLAILGRDGGPLADSANAQIIVPGEATEHIQEAHQVIMHLILDVVERAFMDSE
jgi:D-sedoheptulose 7-phosphate isomerase